MQRLEVSGAVRPIYGSLGVKRLSSGEVVLTWRWSSIVLSCYFGVLCCSFGVGGSPSAVVHLVA